MSKTAARVSSPVYMGREREREREHFVAPVLFLELALT